MKLTLEHLIFAAGIGHLLILIASAQVPVRLQWRTSLAALPTLHRQLYWVYGAFTVLSIIALGLISIVNAPELAAGSLLARSFCAYVTVFWALRLSLQPFLAAREHLTTWWLTLGYHTLTVFFISFVLIFAWAAIHPAAH